MRSGAAALSREDAERWIEGASYGAILYHGTNSPRDVSAIYDSGFRSGAYGMVFATSFDGEARGYAQDNPEAVLPVAVRLEQPYVIPPGANARFLLTEDGFELDPSPAGQRRLAERMIEYGYDGMVMYLPEDLRDPSDPYPARQIVRVFDTAKIKPVSG